ncbi:MULTISPECIES: helix-turn-helix domain-containing protein [Streptomyces]|uniref:AraC family transcriptional regulator n=1 Tax=Streptomyces dengpaensis TaxID=2049881 RepID=A0ABM6SK35_9ACTN|nr:MULTISPECIES: helix-turn-helix domain-containing protein [Streptomyces]AVH54982.1 AraC family transcriptional regulator [Streptomyces dengpaensis]PIB08280.1 AraC family transcriptional regulator [Streptomyces sp. HG99]
MPVRAEELSEPADPCPPPGLVTIGRFDQRPGYRVNRPRGADSWLFTWTTGGRGRLAQGAALTVAGAGDLVVQGPGVPHHYAVEPGAGHWAFWWVHCQARASWPAWLRPYALDDGLYAVAPAWSRALVERGGAGGVRSEARVELSEAGGVRSEARGARSEAGGGVRSQARMEESQVRRERTAVRIEAAFRRMLADARWTGDGPPPSPADPSDGEVAVAHGAAARELALCSLEEIVLLATARAEARRSGVDPRIHGAASLIAADPAAPHTVRSLAEAVSLSPSRFAHLFTEQLGRSPMRALRDARLLHAARLLEATDLPVERVAAASGFPSPFHFNRVFRQRYGTPPGAYRTGTAHDAGEAAGW